MLTESEIESELILHLMFQVQYTELCTIIPSHFTKMPGLHAGTRALDLVDPVASQDVALFWAEGETMMPMAKALVSVIRQMKKSGELPFELPVGLSRAEAKSATAHAANLKKKGKADAHSNKPYSRKSPKRPKISGSAESDVHAEEERMELVPI